MIVLCYAGFKVQLLLTLANLPMRVFSKQKQTDLSIISCTWVPLHSHWTNNKPLNNTWSFVIIATMLEFRVSLWKV